MPKDADPGVWIISDGKLKAKPTISTDEPAKLGSVCDAYYKDQLDKADTTLVRGNHPHQPSKKLLGAKTKLESLNLETLQGYVKVAGSRATATAVRCQARRSRRN